MYLVSCYFDEKSNERIQQFIRQIAKRTGNSYMLDHKVPAHITIAAFETDYEFKVIEELEKIVTNLQQGTLQWASVGVFLPYVLYISPVYNIYLHELMVRVNEAIKPIENISIRSCYQPFQWIPHTTVAKKLSQEEMAGAFEVLQKSFGMFTGRVTRIGLAKTNPYQDVISWDLSVNEG